VRDEFALGDLVAPSLGEQNLRETDRADDCDDTGDANPPKPGDSGRKPDGRDDRAGDDRRRRPDDWTQNLQG
jgi:hypothetical protein